MNAVRFILVAILAVVAGCPTRAAPAPFPKSSRAETASYEQLCRKLRARGINVLRVEAASQPNVWRVEAILWLPYGDVPCAEHSVFEVRANGGDRRAPLRVLLGSDDRDLGPQGGRFRC